MKSRVAHRKDRGLNDPHSIAPGGREISRRRTDEPANAGPLVRRSAGLVAISAISCDVGRRRICGDAAPAFGIASKSRGIHLSSAVAHVPPSAALSSRDGGAASGPRRVAARLARRIGVHPNTLAAVVRVQPGRTFSAWRDARRLERASVLLGTRADLSIRRSPRRSASIRRASSIASSSADGAAHPPPAAGPEVTERSIVPQPRSIGPHRPGRHRRLCRSSTLSTLHQHSTRHITSFRMPHSTHAHRLA